MTSKDSEPEGDKVNAPPVKEEEEQEEQQGETRPQPHAAPSPTAQGDDDKQAKPHHQETPQYPHQVPMMHPPASNSIELGRTWSETIFPMKLYDILCNPEFHHAISWMPHGRSWKVLNKDFFMEEICPQYFAQTRYESFIRQVNGWGFKRMRREGPDRSSYYHENFLRGYPNMIDHMRRLRIILPRQVPVHNSRMVRIHTALILAMDTLRKGIGDSLHHPHTMDILLLRILDILLCLVQLQEERIRRILTAIQGMCE
ncbi:HSF36, heat shock transcription factor DNA-binding domain-containing protein, DNA binding, transcription factor [Thalassiosira pseudonana CCMP1335]